MAGNKNSPPRKSSGQRFFAMEMKREEGAQKDRVRTISFSSEEPYNRYFGPEILDHAAGAVDLQRLNEIGVLLYNHHRDYVVGKILRAWTEGGRGMAEVEFDTDDDAEKIFRKVECGTLKGVSVGYQVESWESVMPGKVSSDGRFTGPCEIARKWAPTEISIVSIPADATVGVGRECDESEQGVPLDVLQRQIDINKNYIKKEE